MAKLATIADMVTQARRLVQDEASDRYPDVDYYEALNMGLFEAYRLRPDLFRSTPDDVPQFATTDGALPNPVDAQYTTALILFITGMVQLQDDEGNEDARSSTILNAFVSKLINHAA